MTAYGPWVASALTSYLSGKTVKAMLIQGYYDPSPDHQFLSVSNGPLSNQVSGSGYTAGGVVVTGMTATYDAGLDTVEFTCPTVEFGTLTVSDIGGIVFYIDTGSAATSPLLAVDMFSAPVSVTALEVSYVPSADGLIAASVI